MRRPPEPGPELDRQLGERMNLGIRFLDRTEYEPYSTCPTANAKLVARARKRGLGEAVYWPLASGGFRAAMVHPGSRVEWNEALGTHEIELSSEIAPVDARKRETARALAIWSALEAREESDG